MTRDQQPGGLSLPTSHPVLTALVVLGLVGAVAAGWLLLDGSADPRGIAAVDDPTGDERPADTGDPSARAPLGVDVERVSLESAGRSFILKFTHVANVEEASGTVLYGTPGWVVMFWPADSPETDPPHSTLYITAEAWQGGLARDLAAAMCPHVEYCSFGRTQKVEDADVRLDGPFLRVEFPLTELAPLGPRFRWTAEVTASPSPNRGKSWRDCIPGCPDGHPSFQHRLQARFPGDAAK